MIALGVVSALLMAMIPIIVLLVINARADRPVWQIAFDISGAVALDLVLVMLLSRLFVSDIAAWVAKGIWVVVAVVVLVHRKRTGRSPQWPVGLTRTLLLRALFVGCVGLGVSLIMSRACAHWDRQFHIPLTTSLRGQTAPFVNVYEPWRELFYHYGGDIYGANLQSLSFGILHSSHTLSLIHDFGFFWLGVCVALTLHSAGLNRTFMTVVVYLTMLFSGPVTMLHGDKIRPSPWSMVNFICVSWRPHVPLGVLLIMPFIALPIVRMRDQERDVSLYDLLVPMSACTAISMITDEFSVGAVGLALGCLWLWRPRVFGKTRVQGMLFFGGLALSMVGGTLIFKGTLGPGGPHYPLAFDWPHSPGFYTPSLTFSQPHGLSYFILDLLPILGVFLGGVFMLLRSRDELFRGTFIAYSVMTFVAVLLFSTLVYNGTGLQNHRFLTAPMLFGPMFAAVWLLPRHESRSVVTSFPAIMMMGTIGLGTATSLEWQFGQNIYPGCIDVGLDGQKFYDVDCRAETGGGVGEKARSMYVERSIVYRYSGCRPTYIAGPAENMDGHDIKFGQARFGIAALAEVHNEPRFTPKDADLAVACPVERNSDPACRYMEEHGACTEGGSRAKICTMTPAMRRSVLGK